MPISRDPVFNTPPTKGVPAFGRVMVDYLVMGGARISWMLHRLFNDPTPHNFQLQVGRTGNPLADDWTNVGPSAGNAAFAIDDERRVFNKEFDLHYRVVLTTPKATYTSLPMPIVGSLNRRDWLIAREMARQRKLLHRTFTGWKGWILKRKRVGDTPDPENLDVSVTDPLTGEVLTTQRGSTIGTEFVGGYFDPFQFEMQISPSAHYPHRDQSRGTVDDQSQQAEAVAFPMLSHKDIFVHDGSDRRFEVRPAKAVAEYRGVPVIMAYELRLIPTTDIIYEIEVPETAV